MKRYYFYKKSKYRAEERTKGIIDLDLCALYSEDVYYNSSDKEGKSFTYFDELTTKVCTELKAYTFYVDTGTDSAHGHWAKSTQELINDLTDSGYIQVSEGNYNRLRALAIALLFRLTQELFIPLGDNYYTWHNDSDSRCWDIRLLHTNYQPNRKGLDERMSKLLGFQDYSQNEEIRIFIFKSPDFKNSKFSISSSHFNSCYSTLEETRKFVPKHDSEERAELTENQYLRLRKICQRLMFDFSELDISKIRYRQEHRVTIL